MLEPEKPKASHQQAAAGTEPVPSHETSSECPFKDFSDMELRCYVKNLAAIELIIASFRSDLYKEVIAPLKTVTTPPHRSLWDPYLAIQLHDVHSSLQRNLSSLFYRLDTYMKIEQSGFLAKYCEAVAVHLRPLSAHLTTARSCIEGYKDRCLEAAQQREPAPPEPPPSEWIPHLLEVLCASKRAFRVESKGLLRGITQGRKLAEASLQERGEQRSQQIS